MKPRYITTGRNSWSTRSGYTYAPRNDGAKFEPEAGPVFHWSIRAFCIGFTAAVCAYSAGVFHG